MIADAAESSDVETQHRCSFAVRELKIVWAGIIVTFKSSAAEPEAML